MSLSCPDRVVNKEVKKNRKTSVLNLRSFSAVICLLVVLLFFGTSRALSDRGQIAYEAVRLTSGWFRWDIATVEATGASERLLTKAHGGGTHPSWSPEGNAVVFSQQGQLATVTSSGDNFRVITSDLQDQGDLWPAWSSKNNEIAFSRGTSSSSAISILTSGYSVEQITDEDSRNWLPSWSPDGEKIAFMSDRSGQFEIYVVNRNGMNLRQVTDGVPNCGRHATTSVNPLGLDISSVKVHGEIGPSWSPTGDEIAFASDCSGNWELYKLSLATTKKIERITETAASEVWPAWSPHADRLVFSYKKNGDFQWQLATVNQDGTGRQKLTENRLESRLFPAWDP